MLCGRELATLARLWVVILSIHEETMTQMTPDQPYPMLIPSRAIDLKAKSRSTRILQQFPYPSASSFWYNRQAELIPIKQMFHVLYASTQRSSQLCDLLGPNAVGC